MKERTGTNAYEPAPVPNERPAVWDLVIQDMTDRDAVGLAKYGTRLQPLNGRRALIDLYQELLDGAVYARQAIEEEKLLDQAIDSLFDAIKFGTDAEQTRLKEKIDEHFAPWRARRK